MPADRPFVSLAELGAFFCDPTRATPTRDTLVKRGRRVAEANGLTVITVDRHGFVPRVEVERLAGIDGADAP